MALPVISIYENYTFTGPVSQIGTGKTVTVKICSTKHGNPSAIGSLSETCAEGATNYTATFARADLQTDLASLVGTKVSVHWDDGAATHRSREYQVVDNLDFDA
jgi:hypothetical protein